MGKIEEKRAFFKSSRFFGQRPSLGNSTRFSEGADHA